jgi:hypothetical protein
VIRDIPAINANRSRGEALSLVSSACLFLEGQGEDPGCFRGILLNM